MSDDYANLAIANERPSFPKTPSHFTLNQSIYASNAPGNRFMFFSKDPLFRKN